MDCDRTQEEILNSFDEATFRELQPETRAHLDGCARCATFVLSQKSLDMRLSTALRPPQLSPAFRSVLRERIRRDTRGVWPEALPDILHLVSCVVATLLCAVFVPSGSLAVFATGTIITALTYLLMTAIRSSFDRLETPER
jgi:hypothetical protein